MADLLNAFGDAPASQPLTELRISKEASLAVFFTSEAQEAILHYIDDETVKAYVHCLGHGNCPACHVGQAPSTYLLLPVYSIDEERICVLRVSKSRGPGSLGPALRAILSRPDISNVLVQISREQSRYTLRTSILADGADRGAREIQEYVSKSAHSDLGAAFLRFSFDELCAIERIKRRLGFMPFRMNTETESGKQDGLSPAPF